MTVPRTLPPGRGARLRLLHWLPLSLLLLILPAPRLVIPVSAQAPAVQGIFGDGVELALVAGRTFYQRDEFCGLWDLYATSLGLIASAGGVGASVAFIGDYPWPAPPPPNGDIYLDRGPSLQAVVELFPLHFLGEQGRRVDARLRPFVGGGLQATWDGETFPAGTERPGPVYAVQGSIDPLIIYGATLRVPIGDSGLGLVARFQGNTLLDVAGEYLTDQGQTVNTEGKTLNWSELRVGFSLAR